MVLPWEAGETAGSGFAALSGANFTGYVNFTGDNYNGTSIRYNTGGHFDNGDKLQNRFNNYIL